jgi:hypothetical protein
MQAPQSQAALRNEFSESIRAVQQFKQQQPKPSATTSAAAVPNIDPKKFLSGDGSNGDIADLGICKLVFDFLQELHRRFPQRRKLEYTINRFWQLAQVNLSVPGKLLQQMYDQCVARKKDVFHTRTDENEAIVVDELAKVHYFRMCQIKTMWCPELDQRARKTIWEHISRIIKVVTIVSKFSVKSRQTLNRLANETLNEQERKNIQHGEFDVVSLLDNIKDRVLDSDEMMESIVKVADQHTEELAGQGMKPEDMNQSPF